MSLQEGKVPAASPSGGRVLVVDDDQAVRQAVGRVLETDGFVVEIAESTAAGLTRARDVDFDVVLTDIIMPDANGIELLRGLRQHNLDTPVILMT
jgi:CheY-like chemotaxis protein